MATGKFQAHMMVELVNDGPVTLLLDSRRRSEAGTVPRVRPVNPVGLELCVARRSTEMRNTFIATVTLLALSSAAFAQQRPLVTEDPETVGANVVLLEGGLDYQHSIEYPVSGLEGNLWKLPSLGVSFGLGTSAELQIDGGLFNHLSITLAHRRTAVGRAEFHR